VPRTSARWTTPESWLKKPEFSDHVGIEIWGKQSKEETVDGSEVPDIWAEQLWTEDDEYTAQSVRHLLHVADQFLSGN
jgi:hypothetical protein